MYGSWLLRPRNSLMLLWLICTCLSIIFQMVLIFYLLFFIIVNKKQTCTFCASYDDVVAFLSNVSSFYFTIFYFISCFIKFYSYFITLFHCFCFQLSSSSMNYNIFIFYLCRSVKVGNFFMANCKRNLL